MKEKRRRELILLACLLVLSGVSFLFIRQYQKATTKNATVVIFVEDKETGRYSLSEDQTIRVTGKDDGENLVVIKGGAVEVKEATCPDKICVHHQKISKNGETIVCLPNRVVVEVQSEEDAEVDATTH